MLSYVCQGQPAQNSAGPATSQRPLQRLLNSKPISDFGETLFCKGRQRESFKHKATQVQTPDFAETGVILKIDFSLIENSMRVLNQ